jgi:hypothetical protein
LKILQAQNLHGVQTFHQIRTTWHESFRAGAVKVRIVRNYKFVHQACMAELLDWLESRTHVFDGAEIHPSRDSEW